ncbi:Glyoxylate/hydroxypyruvate reductase B [Lentilactobacillus parabuchneri]|uniref:phosphoglycerate dehydrogenase n=1 Tax=Lentilactobacillus parabuchneri TaxID=152331 RepID=UPI000A0F51C1|nr:phosphoglycerate dehydrogenase [Lentilactobacillus parabuchneri]ORN11004.1 Glyoxylate/hydroxypyruvate reductase B [Lentilactobacillus parabuchneri]
MGKKVAVPQSLSQAGKDYLVNHGMNVVELPDTKAETITSKAADVDGIVLMTEPFPNETINRLPNLKIIARHGVGFDNIDTDYMAQNNIWVTITPNANAATVAETTLAEILDISKNVTAISDHMRKGDFNYKSSHMGFDLAGKTLGIMGYGRIGKMVAKKVSSLDLNILIYDPFVNSAEYGKVVDKETLLTNSDVITLHMAVTPENKQGFSKREFELMKKSAVLINLGRGSLVKQDDLIDALKTREIRAAALDVFDEEPLPLTSDFYKLDNVLLTPHIASNTTECMARMAVDSASEVVRVLSAESPKWPVNSINRK